MKLTQYLNPQIYSKLAEEIAPHTPRQESLTEVIGCERVGFHYQIVDFPRRHCFFQRFQFGCLVVCIRLKEQFHFCFDFSSTMDRNKKTRNVTNSGYLAPKCAFLFKGVAAHGFVCSANQHPKSTVKKKGPQTFAHLMNFSKNVSSMFDNHTVLLF